MCFYIKTCSRTLIHGWVWMSLFITKAWGMRVTNSLPGHIRQCVWNRLPHRSSHQPLVKGEKKQLQWCTACNFKVISRNLAESIAKYFKASLYNNECNFAQVKQSKCLFLISKQEKICTNHKPSIYCKKKKCSGPNIDLWGIPRGTFSQKVKRLVTFGQNKAFKLKKKEKSQKHP